MYVTHTRAYAHTRTRTRTRTHTHTHTHTHSHTHTHPHTHRKACQTEHWKGVHKAECKSIPAWFGTTKGLGLERDRGRARLDKELRASIAKHVKSTVPLSDSDSGDRAAIFDAISNSDLVQEVCVMFNLDWNDAINFILETYQL